ncbi:DUF1289 domain-containing protein [Pantoea agglomerans]|uniref:DUF1289 domain-containing protein n=1 Tax=Enterobacter agglomerans TaxID=549 RepID=UPI0002554A6D|nr:DUF1289 domain-containing protein [Pantoea agglomerans]MBO0639807.1 DUF1289 domain-containing protein [Pantoea agglomerans]NEH20474.1 DUF1289 domain-containing protein [Pantoea agglomerans]HAT95703.1 DUF1289 domain-containing protein [Escherichia coli]
MAIKSPCTDMCFFNGSKGWCTGCGRTLKEAREWKKLSPYHRKEIERKLSLRLKIISDADASD